jgi:hypothetical protein
MGGRALADVDAMTAPTACMHPDWEWTGTGYKCKTAGCGRMSADHRHPGAVTFGERTLASGSTSPVTDGHERGGPFGKCQRCGATGPAMAGGAQCVPSTPTKPDWTLFPWLGAERALEAVQYGAEVKHSRGDWRTRYTRDQLMAKVMRHLTADLMGEGIDAESSIPHVACACADLLFLLELEPGKGGNGT